jgi:hypothetical protein
VNKDFVIFYERLPTGMTTSAKPKAAWSSLFAGLRKLGLTEVTTEELETALEVCFPNGTTSQDEANVLRSVYRHLKRSGSG